MARAVFDDGSTLSFITTRLARKLGATPMGYEYRALGRFGDSSRQDTRFSTFEVPLQLRNGSHLVLEANAVEHVSTPLTLSPLDVSECLQYCNESDLAETLVDEPTEVEIDILIGLDYYYKLISDKQWRCNNGLVLMETQVGFVITGFVERSLGTGSRSSGNDHQLIMMDKGKRNDYDIERFWRLEEVGITDKPGQTDDDAALEHFNKTVTTKDGRYEVQWPFKEDCPDFADNFNLALRRLTSVYKRISKDGLLERYGNIFEEQEKLGIIEEAPDVPQGVVNYLPHHAVVTPQKTTTKVRLVFDGSAKQNVMGQSFNDAMYRGPVLLNDLCGLLLRFRVKPIAVVSDVEKAFLQVSLQVQHRDCTRFLWLRDESRPPTMDNIKEMRYARVVFGAKASPFLLAATINHHMASVGTPTAIDIMQNTYVDNVFAFFESTEEAQLYYKRAKDLFAMISMNLREWYSNDTQFVDGVPEHDRGKGETTSVLGVKWKLSTDQLHCSAGHMETTCMTKRSVLKSITTLYDPCGWFSPVSVKGKILIQRLWETKQGWDDPLDAELTMQWLDLAADIHGIKDHAITRCLPVISSMNEGVELHCFCDASTKAYSAAVYLRQCGQNIRCNLVFAKARVAPLKKLTIPKLELVGALIGSRLVNFVSTELRLPIRKMYLWSDSACVLQWMKTDKVLTVFVANRVKQIKECSGLNFRYVPTKQNPADIPTKGMKLSDLKVSELWSHGPTWLKLTESNWPSQTEIPVVSDEEVAKPGNVSLQHSPETDTIFDLTRFATLPKLHRTTSYVLRALAKFRKATPPTGPITVPELRRAKAFWNKRVQKQNFSPILSNSKQPRWQSIRSQLGLFVDGEGFIRCQGRFSQSETLAQCAKTPLLLPKGHPYTDLVILDCHSVVLHSGLKHTLAETRTAYWIPNGRLEVKRVLRECLTCRRWTGGAFKVPTMPPLPSFRSSIQRPFSCTGLDYLGPLFVRSDKDSLNKVWVALFTCAATRAIHLEVVGSLSADDFLLCLRRFVASYGKPDLIVSDNAKHFKLTNHTIAQAWKAIMEASNVREFSSKMGIEWKFITEHAPWMGGFYERLVASVKSALKKSIGTKTVAETELRTLVLEISAVLNNRPLLYSEDAVGEQALTPAHLLFRATYVFPEIPDIEEYRMRVTQSETLIEHWKAGQKLLRAFWDIWQRQYLVSLRERAAQQTQRGASQEVPVVGATVLLMDKTPRGTWRMGRIIKLLPSFDMKVRSAMVKLPSGAVLKRPLKLLCPLECTAIDDQQHDDLQADPAAGSADTGPPRRPVRAKAVQARAAIRDMADE